MPRDFYEILGVGRQADATAIKKAYRRLAKKYHPDVNKGDEAAARFKEGQSAYDVLSDPPKRKLYDQFGHAGVQGHGDHGGGRRTYTTPGGFSFSGNLGGEFSLDDIFQQFFGKGGAGANFRQGAPPPEPRRSRDIHHTLRVDFQTAARGGTAQLMLGGERLEMKISPGAAHGDKLRLRGKGEPSPGGGTPGDLILTLHVAPDPTFRREGLDLYTDVPISVDEAVFGTTVEVSTLNGKASLKVPADSGSGRKLRLRGAGIQDRKGRQGDLYAVIQVHVPQNPSAEVRALFEKLRGKLPNPRDPKQEG